MRHNQGVMEIGKDNWSGLEKVTGNGQLYLFVDDSVSSQNATATLEQAGVEFVRHDLTQYTWHNFNAPILYCPDGQFEGFERIERYVGRKYGQVRSR